MSHEDSNSSFADESSEASLDSYFDPTSLTDDDSGQQSVPDPTRWDSDPLSQMRRVETVLFLAKKPVSLKKLGEQACLEDATQARTIVGQLNSRYDRAAQAFHINQVAGGYQLMTRPQFADWIGRIEQVPSAPKLSAPAMETLTVIAYRQPIIKAEIEAIRGVACGEMLRQLLESNLIKISGRSEKLGRPFLYTTTKEFLTWFGLSSLQELPKAKELLGTGLPDWASLDNNF